MLQPASVLIVDTSSDSRAVLRTALERRGLHTFEANGAEHGLALARMHQPDLIVLDMEDVESAATATDFRRAVSCQNVPLVLLGTARMRTAGLGSGEFVAKPYHYAPLIHKIEQLLQAVSTASEH